MFRINVEYVCLSCAVESKSKVMRSVCCTLISVPRRFLRSCDQSPAICQYTVTLVTYVGCVIKAGPDHCRLIQGRVTISRKTSPSFDCLLLTVFGGSDIVVKPIDNELTLVDLQADPCFFVTATR